MSSPHLPSDCTMHGPSWDEFDRSDELDYNSDSDRENDEQGTGHSRNFVPVAPPGFDATVGQNQRNMDETHHNQSSGSLLYLDQLPNSVSETGRVSPSERHLYGPSLPPGFLNGSEDDPEDPGDPEDPDEGDSRSAVPNMSSLLQSSVLSDMPSSSFSQSMQFGPNLHNSSDIFSPSLPEEEIRRPRETFLLPPPEPGEAQSPNTMNSRKRIIGPAMPDLLPTVASTEDEDEEEDSKEIYGPAVPCDLQNRPSTSGRKDFDVEVPTDDETCGLDGDNSEVFGPVPPWEQKENSDDGYEERLIRLEALQASKAAANKRPEWMIQPPKRLGAYGLQAKTFSREKDSEGSEKARLEWVETPAERKKRLEQSDPSVAGPSGISFKAQRDRDADAAQAQIATALQKNRGESLLDMHQRKRKCGTDENGSGVVARRPFDRDRDMDDHGIGRMGNLNADVIKERCGQLSSRFAPSTARKYL